MPEILNTLYIATDGTYLHLDHDTVRVEQERETVLRVPLLQLGAVVCFGNVLVSPSLMHRCADDGRAMIWLDRNGRFKARLEGPVSGNVLLRRAQYDALTDADASREIARCCTAAKLQNSRHVLLRAAREATDPADADPLRAAGAAIATEICSIAQCGTTDSLRGHEGNAAREYFAVFDRMVRHDRAAFAPRGRSRRPPLCRFR